MLRVLTNLMVLALLAGSGYLVWYISVTQSLTVSVIVGGGGWRGPLPRMVHLCHTVSHRECHWGWVGYY